MSEQNQSQDKYQFALEYARHEGELFWQIFGAFLLIHTVFLAFLLRSVLGSSQIAYHPGAFLTALIGILLCIPWGGLCLRRGKYYFFYMAKAKEAEPSGWNLLNGDRDKFDAGCKVIIQNKPYQLGQLARMLRAKRSMPTIIAFFFGVYLFILIANNPWK